MMRNTLLIFFFLLAKFSTAQTEQLSVKQIDSIVISIDSLKGLKNIIVDGKLTPKGKKKPKGGFSDTYFSIPETNQLLKVEHGESLYNSKFISYYFHNDSLIFIKTHTYTNSGDQEKEISNGQYYFQNGILIYTRESGDSLSKPELLIQDSRRYLTYNKEF